MDISKLEEQLNVLRNKSTLNRVDKAEISRLKQLIKSTYADSKSTIMMFEKTNYSYLVFLKSTGKFYKLTGHSALFFTCGIAPRLGMLARLQADGDFVAKSEEGVVSIRDFDQVAKKLHNLRVLRVKTRRDPNVAVFKLPWSYTEKQLEKFKNENQLKMQRFNQVVLVDNISPTLLLQITELIKIVYENVRALPNPTERETFGYDCITLAAKMEHCYLNISNGRKNRVVGLREMQATLNSLKNGVKILADLRFWSPKTCARIAEHLIAIQDIIIREVRDE